MRPDSMVLSDRDIKEEITRGRIVIEPLSENCIQPASVDLHLDRRLLIFRSHRFPFYIDLKQQLDGLTEEVQLEKNQYFSLQPGEFVLGSTLEHVGLPDDLVARLEGKSSLGRVGLLVHSTAGYVDPGWRGRLTLELSNVSKLPILLYPGMKISQISFLRLSTPAERPYGSPGLGSKYQDQTGPMPTQYFREFDRASLFSLPSIPIKDKTPRARGKGVSGSCDTLKEWLQASEFRGSVRLFAEALNVKLKTVEDWFYRGAEPGRANRLKIYQLTKLPQFAPRDVSQREFALHAGQEGTA
ncbi:MAG: dCTP deaminase [Dehalococcoidia bacterium]